MADWESDDWPLDQWIEQAAAPISVRLLQLQGSFSRGKGLNLAARAAKGDILFFLDADSLISTELIKACIRHTSAGKAFFPVLYGFDDPEHLTGHWVDVGFGHCAIQKAMFEMTQGWPEYKTWGREDDHFYADVASKMPVVRERVNNFFHQWHPDDLLWKNRYSERLAAMAEGFQQIDLAIEQLSKVIPSGSQLILVDESTFGSDPIPSCLAYPFTERDGEYNGPPDDSDSAIHELERLREKGAEFIAFAWMSFWWLEHYPEFRDYLISRFEIVLKNERLLVFTFNESPTARPSSMDRFSQLAEKA